MLKQNIEESTLQDHHYMCFFFFVHIIHVYVLIKSKLVDKSGLSVILTDMEIPKISGFINSIFISFNSYDFKFDDQSFTFSVAAQYIACSPLFVIHSWSAASKDSGRAAFATEMPHHDELIIARRNQRKQLTQP